MNLSKQENIVMEHQKIKVLHINSYYVSRSLYKNLYDYQVEHGDVIRVFVPVRRKRVPVDFERGEYTDISFDFNKMDRYFFGIKHTKIYRDAKKRYKDFPFSIAHAHSLFSNGYVAYRIKENYGIPYVVHVQNTDVNDFFKYALHLRGLGNRILKNAEAVFFASEAYKDCVLNKYVSKRFLEEIRGKSIVIPYGINSFWLENRRREPRKVPDKKIRLLCVGEINGNKNQLGVIKVCEELISRGYVIEFICVGKVVDEKIYEKLNNYSFVDYYPYMPEEKLLELYNNNDVFVMPSITETFGLVYGEAISQGMPVVYTKNQGFDRQFEDGIVGYAVDCFEPKKIADTVEKILSNYSEISRNCIIAVKKFDWIEIGRRYEEVYQRILKK